MSLPLIPYFNPRIESRSRKMMGEFESCLSDPWYVLFFYFLITTGMWLLLLDPTQSELVTSMDSASTKKRRFLDGKPRSFNTNMII